MLYRFGMRNRRHSVPMSAAEMGCIFGLVAGGVAGLLVGWLTGALWGRREERAAALWELEHRLRDLEARHRDAGHTEQAIGVWAARRVTIRLHRALIGWGR